MTEARLLEHWQRAREDWNVPEMYEALLETLAEVHALRSALRKFGQHADTCGRAHYLGSVPCRCGLDAALGGSE